MRTKKRQFDIAFYCFFDPIRCYSFFEPPHKTPSDVKEPVFQRVF